MAQDPFSGPGHGGGQPRVPGGQARNGAPEAAAAPEWYPRLPPDETDYDPDAILDEIIDAVDSGREQIPDQPGPRGAAISLGEACDVDLHTLAAMTGPDGLAGLSFDQHAMTDAMRPGPLLDALTGQAVREAESLSDNELLGEISAAGRLRAYAEWLELAGMAEFARRRDEQYEASKARGDKPRHRDGEYAAEELACEMQISRQAAGRRLDEARNLAGRLPDTFAGMRAGTISGDKAWMVHRFTAPLDDDKAAQADKVLAEAAPGCSPGALYARARRLCYRLDAEAFDRAREEAARTRRRVEVRQEDSGNSQVSMREMPVEEAAAVRAQVWAEAARLRNAGLDLPLREIRVLVLTDRALGRDPWERLVPTPEPPADDYADGSCGDDDPAGLGADVPDADVPDADLPGDPPAASDGDGDGGGTWDGDDGDDDDGPDEGRPGGQAGAPFGRGPAPLPALITLLIHDGTIGGWSNAPGEADGMLLDPDQARAFLQAASRHPRTRWCATVVNKDGEAVAHGCSRGSHTWDPPDSGPGSSANARDGTARDGPDQLQRAQVLDLLRRLNITLEPIAKGSCDHRHREERYTPSRKLQHLVRARTNTCCAPGCGAQAITGEMDHTVPYPKGSTDECNLGPPCIRHHKVKHAPGWKLEQIEPGVMKWTTPSGRSYTTRPTRYDE